MVDADVIPSIYQSCPARLPYRKDGALGDDWINNIIFQVPNRQSCNIAGLILGNCDCGRPDVGRCDGMQKKYSVLISILYM